MTRKKVKLAFITNDASRKATFKKRKKGLMKKVNELSTLCGIDVCAIMYSPYDTNPEVWPTTMTAVHRVITQFKRMPEMEQSKKMMNQESFIRQRIAKACEQLKKQRKENRDKEIVEVMFGCLSGKLGLSQLMLSDFNELGLLIDRKLMEINKRIGELVKSNGSSNELLASGVISHPNVEDRKSPAVVDFSHEFDGGVMQRSQWFNNNNNNFHENNDNLVGFGSGDQNLMTPFGDANYPMWSCAFFS